MEAMEPPEMFLDLITVFLNLHHHLRRHSGLLRYYHGYVPLCALSHGALHRVK